MRNTQPEENELFHNIVFHGAAPGRDWFSAFLWHNHLRDIIGTFPTLQEAMEARRKVIEEYQTAKREGRKYKRPAPVKSYPEYSAYAELPVERKQRKPHRHTQLIIEPPTTDTDTDTNIPDTENTFDFETWVNSDMTIEDLEETYATYAATTA